MPTVKIELLKGRDHKTVFQIRDAVMDAVVVALQLPDHNRNIRVIEYEPGYFQMNPPYEMLVEVSLFEGRTRETKRKLFAEITSRLATLGLMGKDHVLIILNEQPRGNWGVRGGIPGDELDLGFKVNV